MMNFGIIYRFVQNQSRENAINPILLGSFRCYFLSKLLLGFDTKMGPTLILMREILNAAQ